MRGCCCFGLFYSFFFFSSLCMWIKIQCDLKRVCISRCVNVLMSSTTNYSHAIKRVKAQISARRSISIATLLTQLSAAVVFTRLVFVLFFWGMLVRTKPAARHLFCCLMVFEQQLYVIFRKKALYSKGGKSDSAKINKNNRVENGVEDERKDNAASVLPVCCQPDRGSK